MALPSSGPLSLTDIQTEFGGTNPIGLSEYYAGGGLVPAGTTGTFGAVPSSGTISIQNFYGTANLYTINNSLRFRRSVSAHLSRTSSFSGTTNTISFWIKRGELGTRQVIFGWSDNSSNALYFQFDTSNRLELYNLTSGSNNLSLITTQVFRDPSAWYHFVVVLNTTQATASNRAQFYVNGSQITAFATATYPAQNTSLQLGNSRLWNIGREGNTGNNPGDYYLAEWNFIDGQALTPSSFGETSATTGSWIPKAYTGTYGTNGFYQKYSSIALTSGSNTGLGQDFSGNGNFYNTNNISVTAGTTYDAMTDSPTPASATVGNYAVINPLWKGSAVTITNGNLSYSGSGATNSIAYSTFGITSGKWYAEWTQGTTPGGGAMYVGISLDSINPNHSWLGQNAGEYSYLNSNGFKANNNVQTAYGATWGINDVIGVAFDADARTITFYKNGASQGVAYSSIPAGNYYFANGNNPGSTVTGNWNFGQRAFTGSLPTGFVALNTFNIPTSTIVKGNSYMDATLYTGNGANRSITNASSFRPDLVWIKSRSAATDNKLTDSVRGATLALISNTGAGETTDTTGLTAFNSNGFNLGTNTTYNNNTSTYVGWQWQAGSSTVTNTNGSVSAQVRANTTTGFSIVTYTGPGSGSATIGHGLGIAPSMIILRTRNSVNNWGVYHRSIGNTAGILLNDITASIGNVAFWNNTTPTSSVFTVGTFNTVANPFVAYCWAEIAGFSAFGSYTGNGSADGPFVYLGFRPKFIMIKSSSATGNWRIFDTSLNLYNLSTQSLAPNSSSSENTGTTLVIDILSNGIKMRGNDSNTNGSGVTYIYAAFAENPFKNANAR
jgi:hypothetical protein